MREKVAMEWTTDDLLPNLLQKLRKRTRPFISVVAPDGALEHFSVEDIHRASNRAAWFLHRNLGNDGDEKFFYMGPSDVRYLIWVLAAMKLRKCVICPSPGNTVPSNLRFFSTVGAQRLLYAPESCGSLQPLLQSLDETMISLPTPSYYEIMSGAVIDEYPFSFSFDDLRDIPCMGLHTSGTSGHPKPIYWNHTAIASVVIPIDFDSLPSPPKRPHLLWEILEGNNVFAPFPLYHFGGVGLLLRSFATNSTIVIPAAGTPLSPANFARMIQVSSSTCALTPPSILEALLSSASDLKIVSGLKHVAYSGGPLNPVLGKRLADVIPHMFPLYGCTEGAGPYLESTGDNTYWNGMKFIDMGQRMEEVIPGLYELIVTRTDHINRSQAYFHTCPHLEEYRTSDLFAPIKGSDGWWIFHGRTDNWITMSNGLKMDPTAMENTINAHPDVKGALVAGSHRFRLCLLIELRPESTPENEAERKRILDALWPMIAEANRVAPKFGRIPRELVILTSADKPFSRASKGTIQRRLSIAAYEEEIDDLYAKVEGGLLADDLPILDSTNAGGLLPFLRDLFFEALDDKEIADDDDLFARGMDSLSIFLLTARIKAALRKSGVSESVIKKVDNALLFKSTTISRLARRLSLALSEPNGASHSNDDGGMDEMRGLLARYEAQIPMVVRHGRQSGQTIVLTGSRGSLGSYILSALLARQDVKMVYCLNRSAEVEADQATLMKERGLPGLPKDRVKFLQVKLAEPKLGLTEEVYSSLMAHTTAIVHNAYPVNFLMPVKSFEPQIQGLINLLRLAQEGLKTPTVLFVSSIAAAVAASQDVGQRSIIQESVLDVDEATCSLARRGYAQSKFICERLVEKYASSGGGKAAILRVGQICGPLRGPGVWNTREWAPSMIISSKHLGVAPESIGVPNIDWIPVDALGQIVSELVDDVARRGNGNAVVYNVLNPKATSWAELLSAVKGVVPKTVPAAEWIEKLERSRGTGSQVLSQNPGVKLLDFYKDVFLTGDDGFKAGTVVEKRNLLLGSKTARGLSPVRPENLAKWMKYWGLS